MDNVNFTLTLKREAIMKTKPKDIYKYDFFRVGFDHSIYIDAMVTDFEVKKHKLSNIKKLRKFAHKKLKMIITNNFENIFGEHQLLMSGTHTDKDGEAQLDYINGK